MASATFEEAKARLLQTDETGRSLYDHLADTILRVLEENPGDSLERFEQISLQVKEETFSASAADRKKKPSEIAEAENRFRKEVTELYKPPPPPLNEDGEPVEVTVNEEFTIPNITEQSYYFQQCGVGLSQEESFRIQLALRRLGEKEQVKSVRLWGKILGTQGSYVVAETEFKEGEHPDEKAAEAAGDDAADGEPAPAKKKEVPAEKREGTNKYSYFVCSNAGEPWTLLPDVTPQQVNAARKIKKYFTGNLNAAVVSYPPFPGREREYLRAQIARITAGATISPKGLIALPGDEEEDGEAAEPFTAKANFEAIGEEEIVTLDSWVHHAPAVLQQQGRAVFYAEPKEEGEGEDGDAAAEETVEEAPALGSALSQDEPIIGTAAWSVQVANRYMPKYPVVLVRSNRWPGAAAYAAEGGKRSAHIYIGYGHKFTGSAYSPPLPAPIAVDSAATAAPEMQDPTFEDEKYFDDLDEQAKREAEAKAEGGEDPAEEE